MPRLVHSHSFVFRDPYQWPLRNGVHSAHGMKKCASMQNTCKIGIVVLDSELERIKGRKLAELMNQKKTRSLTEDTPIQVTGKDFNSFIRRFGLVVVDCWAPWCGPCRMMAPILDELAKKHAGKALFGKLNVDENQDVASRFQITTIPTLLIFKDAKLVDRIVGATRRNVLDVKIAHYLESTM